MGPRPRKSETRKVGDDLDSWSFSSDDDGGPSNFPRKRNLFDEISSDSDDEFKVETTSKASEVKHHEQLDADELIRRWNELNPEDAEEESFPQNENASIVDQSGAKVDGKKTDEAHGNANLEALANFRFRLRGEKRKGQVDIDESGPSEAKKSTQSETVIVEPEFPEVQDIGLVGTTSGNLTVRLAVSKEKLSELKNRGLINVKYAQKTPDGKKLILGKDETHQIVASSSVPKSTVDGYLSGFPVVESPTPSSESCNQSQGVVKEKAKKAKKVCAVSTCDDPQDKHYFVFPTKDTAQKLKWIHACQRADKNFNPKNARMCEAHFTPQMIKRDLQAELLGRPFKKQLVKGAVPTLKLPTTFETHSDEVENNGGNEVDENKVDQSKVDENVRHVRKPPAQSETRVRNLTANCAVKCCKNPSGVKYFTFPKDPEIRKVWIQRCKRKVDFVTRRRSVCETHFREKDFKPDLMSTLLGLPAKKELKDDAVPSLNLGQIVIDDSQSEVDDIPEIGNEIFGTDDIENEESLQDKVQRLQAENEQFKLQDAENKKVISDLRAKIVEMEKDKKRDKLKNSRLVKKVKRLEKIRPKEVRKEVKKTIEKRMSPANVKMLMNPEKKWVHYSDQDKVEALVLSTISRKCYNQVRNFKQLQLPHVKTLQRWLSGFDCSPGFQEDAISILKTMKANTKLKMYNICELAFDEVDIKKQLYEIDTKAQRIYGPCNKVQMVVIRGLYQN